MKPTFGHFRPLSLLPLPGWTGCLLLFLGAWLRASDLPAPVTLDFPVSASQAMPAWLGRPETPATTFATLDLPILTPDPAASLLVTVYFREKQDGFMRIAWQGTQGSQVLSDNFYEDIGMANQRSLLISSATLLGDGILTFQCGDSALGIQRIKLEWLENKTALASPDLRALLVTPGIGPTQTANSLNGQPNPVQAGAWQNQLVTVPITDTALRIEQGVELSVDLDQVPASARLALKEAGLALGKHLVVWINQQRAGTVTPAVPDLLDPGFLTDESALASYVGWRDGSFYVPVALLKKGVNALQFSEEDDGASASSGGDTSDSGLPLAIKAVVLQLNYQTSPANTSVAQTLPSSSNASVSPEESPTTSSAPTTP